MTIGYACLTVGVADTGMKTCRQENASPEKLKELISHNLRALENIIDYNVLNGLKLFRISSDVIPFGSSPINQLDWASMFCDEFTRIGNKIKDSGMRVSMHPGQYTVLNSTRREVVSRAIQDLNYHADFLQALSCDGKNKIILHIGGVYGDKDEAIKRFVDNYELLSEQVKKHLVIENDDRSYNIEEVLKISEKTKIPVVFDNLHHAINKPKNDKEDVLWIRDCNKTWQAKDGKQKIHYSQQDPLKRPGGHSKTIDVEVLLDYYEQINGRELDIMLEVKDKNLSAVKCMKAL